MKRNLFLSAVFLLGLASAAGAQTGALLQNTLTNHDVVVLAQAGFNENFIADFISMSRTQFDTSVTGLAEMAKEGLTERLIRVVLAASATPQPGSAHAVGAAATTAFAPAAMIGPPMEVSNRRRAPKLSESAGAPYYRTSTFFWGLWKKKIGVGAGLRAEQPVGAQLGAAYGQMQWVSPTGISAGYVVLP
jgi:hypothetical protein